MSVFKKATKSAGRLRLALIGPAGSGKTWTALELAKELGGRIAVIDSERGSASKYAGDAAEFDVCELDTFSPQTYVDTLLAADKSGYDVVVIDSLSHAWSGKDGAIERVDKAAARSKSGNSFMAWREVTPEHNRMVDAILQMRAHVIVTMRTKTEYVQEKDERTGKVTPRKVGLQPIQRDGLEYEFDVTADLDTDHVLTISKTRCRALDRAVIREPKGSDLAAPLKAWLSDGAPIVELPVPTFAVQEPAPADQVPEKLMDVGNPAQLYGWILVHLCEYSGAPSDEKTALFEVLISTGKTLGVSEERVRAWCAESKKRAA